MVAMPMPHAARFQPVIFSDAGTNMYPLCDAPEGPTPKALLPVLNRPMIAYPLQWLVSAGFRSCLLVAPVAEHAALAAALRTLELAPPSVRDADAGVDAAGAPAAVAGGRTGGRSNVLVSVGNAPTPLADASSAEAPLMYIELLPYGPAPGDTVRSIQHPKTTVSRSRWSTAQLLYWLAATHRLEADPLVVPVDLIAPHLPLASFLSTHLATMPEPPCVSCLFYERGAGEGTGKERERDGPANLFTAYGRLPLRIQEGLGAARGSNGKETVPVYAPLLIMDSDDVSDKNSSDLEVRMSMLWKHPYARVSTSFLDSHVYSMRLDLLLPLLEQHPELNSISEQLVPFIVKCSWQTKLSAKAGWSLAHPHRHGTPEQPNRTPHAAPRDSTSSASSFVKPRCQMVIARLQSEPRRPLPPDAVIESERGRLSVHASGEERFIARANTVPTYLECNRYLLRQGATGSLPQYPLPQIAGCGTVPFEAPAAPPAESPAAAAAPAANTAGGVATAAAGGTAGTSGETAPPPPIHPRAMLSADCIVGAGTQIDERTTIKHSAIGRNCVIGKGARVMLCILMDEVHVGDNAKLENCIVGKHAQIGDRCQLRESDVGPYYVLNRGAESKNEKLVAYEDESDTEV